MWFGGLWYDNNQLPRERVLPQSHPLDGNLRSINVVPERPPLVEKRPFLLPTPGEGGYGRYYHHVNYGECDEGHGFVHNQRSGPPYSGYSPGYQWTRYEHPTSRQPEYGAMRGGFRGQRRPPKRGFRGQRRPPKRGFRGQRRPPKRGAPFLRESRIGWKDSLYSVSGPSANNGSYPPKESTVHSSYQQQHRCKERATQFFERSRDTSSSISSSEVFKKSSGLTEKDHAETASKRANEEPEKLEENNVAEISVSERRSKSPLLIDQTEEPKSNTTDGTESYEVIPVSRRTKAITAKMAEIEKNYRQDLETFFMVIEKLIEKDPSLEGRIQYAVKQSTDTISELHVKEFKRFIAEYDKSTQEFGDPFKKN